MLKEIQPHAVIVLVQPGKGAGNRDAFCPKFNANYSHVSAKRCLRPAASWSGRALATSTGRTDMEEIHMLNNNSPLESLAAFAIVFATGILSTVVLGKYIEKVRRDAQNVVSGAA